MLRTDNGWAFDPNGTVLDYNSVETNERADVTRYQQMAQDALTTDPLNQINPYQSIVNAYTSVRASQK